MATMVLGQNRGSTYALKHAALQEEVFMEGSYNLEQ